MGTTFRVAEDEIQERLQAVLQRHHHCLREYKVKVLAIAAVNYKDDALKLHGFPCAATARVVPDRDHCTKSHQAEISIDLMRWGALTPGQKDALLDHELCHFSIDRDGDGEVRFDTIGRVRIKTKHADFQPSDGFLEVITRHGKDAPEWRSLADVGTIAGEALARRPGLFDSVPPDDDKSNQRREG